MSTTSHVRPGAPAVRERPAMRAARQVGALCILGVGAVHLQQYLGSGYSAVPTIGPLFLLDAIAAAMIAAGLLAPLEAMLIGRRGAVAVSLLAEGGIAIAAGSVAALYISETATVFAFSEAGSRGVIVLAIAVEVTSVILLAPVAFGSAARTRAGPSRRVSGVLGPGRSRRGQPTRS